MCGSAPRFRRLAQRIWGSAPKPGRSPKFNVELAGRPEAFRTRAWKRARTERWKSSPGKRSPVCNRLLLRRSDAWWRAAGGERPVRRITNSIRRGGNDEPASQGRRLDPKGKAVELRGSAQKRQQRGVRWVETEWLRRQLA